MRIYVVQVTPKAHPSKVSQEGYLSMQSAKAFIESRRPRPMLVDSYLYRDENNTEYLICEVTV